MTRVKVEDDYLGRRKREYPDVVEQLGAIWAYLATVPNQDLPQETRDMLRDIKRVKEKYPKRQP